MAFNLPDLPTAGVTIATVANWATKVIDSLNFLKGNAGTVTLGDGLNLGANELTINSIEIVGVDGEVNKAAVEDHTHQDAANCGTLDHGLALTGLTDDDHTQYQKESLLTTAGDIPYATGASAWQRLAIGTALQYLRTNAGATAPEWAGTPPLIKVGTFNNDTADGTQTVTGVGFTPKFLIVGTEGTNKSISIFDGTRQMAIINTDSTLGLSATITFQPYTNGTNFINGKFGAFNADGFTITWSSLTGTAPARTYFYLALT